MRSPLTNISHLPKAPTKIEDDRTEVQDHLKKINLGTPNEPKPISLGSYFWLKLQ